MLGIDEILHLRRAADILGISEATLRNWSRLQLISTLSTDPVSFSIEEIERIRKGILSGEILKLNSRANKTQSTTKNRTIRHLSDKQITGIVQEIMEWHKFPIGSQYNFRNERQLLVYETDTYENIVKAHELMMSAERIAA